MNKFVRAAPLRRIAGDFIRYGLIAAMVLCGSGAGNCLATGTSYEYLDVAVENISYQGNSLYRVDILIYNRSDKAVAVKECGETFLVQTEVLGRWQELRPSVASGVGGALLPPRKGLRSAYILSIPLTLQSLYRNGEGDINMMFRYLIRFVPGAETGLRSFAGESSYWITPKTNTWVLREGM